MPICFYSITTKILFRRQPEAPQRSYLGRPRGMQRVARIVRLRMLRPRIDAPEHLEAMPGVLDRILKELRARGVEYRAGVEQQISEANLRIRGRAG